MTFETGFRHVASISLRSREIRRLVKFIYSIGIIYLCSNIWIVLRFYSEAERHHIMILSQLRSENLKILLHSCNWYMFFIDNFVNTELIKNKINITGSLKCSDNPCWNQGTSSHYFLFWFCWSFSSVLQYFCLNIPVWAYYFPSIHRICKLLHKILLKLILTFKI